MTSDATSCPTWSLSEPGGAAISVDGVSKKYKLFHPNAPDPRGARSATP